MRQQPGHLRSGGRPAAPAQRPLWRPQRPQRPPVHRPHHLRSCKSLSRRLLLVVRGPHRRRRRLIRGDHRSRCVRQVPQARSTHPCVRRPHWPRRRWTGPWHYPRPYHPLARPIRLTVVWAALLWHLDRGPPGRRLQQGSEAAGNGHVVERASAATAVSVGRVSQRCCCAQQHSPTRSCAAKMVACFTWSPPASTSALCYSPTARLHAERPRNAVRAGV
eukprot:scaffold5369_cov374-Prasinococcus_capsulatus_cf.AAC.2